MVDGRAPEDRSMFFSGIDARDPNDVWAVGPLLRHFDGQQWREYLIPGVSEGEGQLEDVVVLSAADVWAVGAEGEDSAARSLIVHWDGTAWTRVPAPSQDGPSGLYTLTAVSPSDIWAAGYRGSGGGLNGRSLLVHWDGHAWRGVTSPDLEVMGNHLQDIAAINGRDIWAVGYSDDSQGTTYLLMHWDGSTWAPASVPEDIPLRMIYRVEATQAGDVWLLGHLTRDQNYRVTLLHFRDGVWQTMALPPSLASGGVGDMVVLGPNDVWLVGSRASGAVAAQWDGAAWREMEVPGLSSGLGALTVLPNGEAWALGSYDVSDRYLFQPVFYHYGPHEVSLVSAVADRERWLNGIAAWPGGLWAVGGDDSASSSSPHSLRGLILRRTGERWEEVAGPNLNGEYSLNAVAALGDGDAWAVGATYDSADVGRTLALHWDGQRWAAVPSPNVGSRGNTLAGVTALAPNDVWAIGSYEVGEDDRRPLTLHWDGNQWEVVSAPDLEADSALSSVVALAPNDVWAVGRVGGWSARQPLLLHWDGTNWRRWSSEPLSALTGALYAVTGVGPGDVWAVGEVFGGTAGPLIIHWDGTEWRSIPSPSPSSHYDIALSGVAALSSTSVWAVGTYHAVGYSSYYSSPWWTLLLHWDGMAWQIEPSLNVGYFNFLYDVAVSDGDVWAVGRAVSSSPHPAIIQRYSVQGCR